MQLQQVEKWQALNRDKLICLVPSIKDNYESTGSTQMVFLFLFQTSIEKSKAVPLYILYWLGNKHV